MNENKNTTYQNLWETDVKQKLVHECVTFLTALITTPKRQKPPKCPSTDKWINKMWYVHTMEYYSAIKRNDILIHVTILINPENIMLSERTQTQKATYYMTPFILNIHTMEYYLFITRVKQ